MNTLRTTKRNPQRILKAIKESSHVYSARYDPEPPQSTLLAPDVQVHPLRSPYLRSFNKTDRMTSPAKSLSLQRRISLSHTKNKTEDIASNHIPSIQLCSIQHRTLFISPRKNQTLSRSKGRQQRLNTPQPQKASSKVEPLQKLNTKHTATIESTSFKDDGLIRSAVQFFNSAEHRKVLLLVKKILEAEPDHLQALELSAKSWLKLNYFEKALVTVKKILKSHPSSPILVETLRSCNASGFFAESIRMVMECKNLTSQESVEVAILEAEAWKGMAQFEKAIHILEAASQRSSGDLQIRVLMQLSSYLEALQRLEEAIQVLQRTPQKDKILVRTNRFGELKQLLTNKSALYESTEELNYLLGYSLYKLGLLASATLHLEQSLQEYLDSNRLVALFVACRVAEYDFYGAQHRLQLSAGSSSTDLQLISEYVHGALCIIKKQFKEGIEILDKLPSHDECIGPLYQNITINRHMFLAYGFHSRQQFARALTHMQIQANRGISPELMQSYMYNLVMIKGSLAALQLNFKEACQKFSQAHLLRESKIQPLFLRVLVEIAIFLEATQNQQKIRILNSSSIIMEEVINLIGDRTCLTSVNAYYCSSLIHACLANWKIAIERISECIERCQDHYWRHYYARAYFHACIHDFDSAIKDCTIAIELSLSHRAECFELRSRCLQIEGDTNRAFEDLQTYVSICPEDVTIHRYAGQLLFQNGAFEDSLAALNHAEIPLFVENCDLFLTKAKTLFLLGQFEAAATELERISTVKKDDKRLQFDGSVLKVISRMKLAISNGSLTNEIHQQLENIFIGQELIEGQIFRKNDYQMLRATCSYYMKDYTDSITRFEKATKLKQEVARDQAQKNGQASFESSAEYKDWTVYGQLMNYNIAICSIFLKDIPSAANRLAMIEVPETEPFSRSLRLFRQFVCQKRPGLSPNEVFPSKNKLSNHFPIVETQLHGTQTPFRLCLPFPKVEPPQIYPKFSPVILASCSIDLVEPRPESTWVNFDKSTIRFTETLQNYPQLSISSSHATLISVVQSSPDENSASSKEMLDFY